MLIFGHDSVFSITVASTRTSSFLRNRFQSIPCDDLHPPPSQEQVPGVRHTHSPPPHPASQSPHPRQLQRETWQAAGFTVQARPPQGAVGGSGKQCARLRGSAAAMAGVRSEAATEAAGT